MSIAISPHEKRQMGGVAKALKARAMGGGHAALSAAMVALGEPLLASGARRMAEHQARREPRYRIWDGHGTYLGPDGTSVTTCSREAWFGSAEQLQRALERFPLAKGMAGRRVMDGKMPYRADIRQLWGAE